MNGKEKPRIFIFSTAYFPFSGGAEVAVRGLTDRLRDFSFSLITPRIRFGLPRYEHIGNVEVFRVGFGLGRIDKLLFPWWGKWRAERLHRRTPAALLWAIMASYAGFAALFFKRSHPGIPLLLTLQEGDSEAYILRRAWMTWSWFLKLFRSADAVQAISHYLARFASKYGFPGSPRVIPNGVAYRDFAAPQNSREALRRAHSIPQDAPLIITVSRLVPKNGISDLIAAIKELPTAYLWIIGAGPLERQLKAISYKLKAQDRIRFLGEMPHAELPKYLQTADVFCRPSYSEGLGNVFLEAMAAGTAIVGTNVGGIPDFLTDGVTGLFAKVGEPQDIAEKLLKVLSDSALAATLRTNGRKLVEERYDWGRIGEEFRELFLRLLETPSRVVIAGEIYPPEIGGLATYTKVVHEAIRSRTAHVGLLTHAEFKIQKSKFKMAPNNPSTSSGYTGQAMQNSKLLRYLRYVFRLLRLS
ncbi:glycosyltransferase family 4 protein, partial [Candidatus Azambacteria bacterium]|nr:glycosyltransferase family 4 protein [Candidatus Azambacteria bacterium]